MTRAGRRAIALVEVLVASVILLAVTSLLYGLLMGGYRVYFTGSARSQLQQTATLALGQLIADLDQTTPGAVCLGSAGLGLTRLQGVSADCRQIWEDKAILYHLEPNSHVLVRWELPAVAAEPAHWSPENLDALLAQGSSAARVLAREVSRFEVTHAGPDAAVAMPLRVTLVVTREVPGSRAQSFELRREICLRNR